jgi:hypothetical protein
MYTYASPDNTALISDQITRLRPGNTCKLARLLFAVRRSLKVAEETKLSYITFNEPSI